MFGTCADAGHRGCYAEMCLQVLGEERDEADHGHVAAGSQDDTEVDRITAHSPHRTWHICTYCTQQNCAAQMYEIGLLLIKN